MVDCGGLVAIFRVDGAGVGVDEVQEHAVAAIVGSIEQRA